MKKIISNTWFIIIITFIIAGTIIIYSDYKINNINSTKSTVPIHTKIKYTPVPTNTKIQHSTSIPTSTLKPVVPTSTLKPVAHPTMTDKEKKEYWKKYDKYNPTPKPDPTPISYLMSSYDGNLKLLNSKSTADNYCSYSEGVILNDSDIFYDYIAVKISMFDSVGNKLGTAMDNIDGLAPGEKWRFKALLYEDACVTYIIEDIIGW
jgi:hypothetical protein